MSAASTFEDFRPRRPAGMGRGALLAMLVHVGLLVALAFGVSWRSSEPTGATAELWAAVPETAAPAAVAPPEPKPAPPPPKVEPAPPKPEVRDAEIAIEKARVEKAKREREAVEAQKKRDEQQVKVEREKVQKAEAAKAERAEAERQAKAREEQLKRIQSQAGSTGAPTATGTGARDAGPSAGYAGRIVARVKPNIVFADSVPSTLRAEVEVRAAPDGTIVGRRLVKPSGNKDWDEAVLRAIDRTEILPRDLDGRVPSPILIEFRP
jgi:colicin import membrane protein